MSNLHYNPAMVSVARESRGWTQRNLADAIGVSQATICKFELGSVLPSDPEIDSIAHALQFSPVLFRQPDQVYTLGSSLIFHRKRVRIPIKIQRRVQAEVNLRRMQVARLLRSIECEHKFVSIPPEAEGDNPERVARRIREIWNVTNGPILDITRVVENAGGIVVLVDFGTRLIDGAHLWIDGMPPIFFMNQDVPGERYRFSLAHEIGHAVMHHSSALEDVEEQAHLFASELLMPRATIRLDLRRLNIEGAARLKKVWKVSMQAIIMRAAHLREIGQSTKRRLFSQISARGYRINEPWPIPMENPTTFARLLKFHTKHLGFTEEELEQDILFTDHLGTIEPAPRLKVADDD